MKVVILQSNYIPWRGYFDLIHDADLFVFYDEVQYTKNDWRNRNKLCDKQGSFWLTIPIAKDGVKKKISEVDLPADDWQNVHHNTLLNCYKNAAFFREIEILAGEVYLDKKWTKLSELNQYLIKRISQKLRINTKFENSASYELKGERLERLLNLLEQTACSEYISGPAARNYLNGEEEKFRERNIILSYKEYPSYRSYKQLSAQFNPAVSILDLVAHIGFEKAPEYIWKNI